MDYDDLVDQFIVNDGTDEANSENSENNGDNKAAETIEHTANKDNEPTSESHSLELMKIHLKTLIHSRQVSLRTAQLDRVKDRNRVFEVQKKEILRRCQGAGPVSIQNSEKRRKVLGNREGTVKVVDVEENTENSAENTDNSTASASDNSTELIPCRLELDYDGYKLSDVLLIPPTDSTPDTLNLLSIQLCQDYDLPAEVFQPAITRCLKDQVEEWQVFQGALEGMKETLPFEEIGPVPLRLDIIVGLHRLEDQLEVDLDPLRSSTESMRKLVEAMRSPDERILPEKEFSAFRPLILHNLLEQLMLWRKAIVFGGYHRDSRSNNLKFHDGDVAVLLNDSAGTPLASVRRHFAHTNTFTPILSTLTLEELDKIEAGRERESRRRKRTAGVSVASVSGTGNMSSSGGGNKRTASTGPSAAIVNNLTGTVRSPPRTLPTPTSYRGSLHRVQVNNNNNSDDEGSTGAPRKRGRKSKY